VTEQFLDSAVASHVHKCDADPIGALDAYCAQLRANPETRHLIEYADVWTQTVIGHHPDGKPILKLDVRDPQSVRAFIVTRKQEYRDTLRERQQRAEQLTAEREAERLDALRARIEKLRSGVNAGPDVVVDDSFGELKDEAEAALIEGRARLRATVRT
jgi:hypothetical protein